ncbi:sulfur transferase domain-containing protein [Pseudanabaena sp. FACHB-2040]|uniref:fused DSP-PTPase phosphatase/NAD kinase-like protein n=1 Tax=Pseudanabaena sp. FACHB-2040 TaxID=2692859 RepID=UPI001688BF8D|nr:protein tyrosine phosphatase family protein [Pseudanabaena sp. FACHB-2040]
MSTEPLASIYHFLPISDAIATAGQPTAEQFEAIRQAGYQVVVNLALLTSDNALPQEPALVESLGMQYVPIPVIWEEPTLADLHRFFAVMEANQDKKVFVHCAANMRVSVFVYLYRCLRLELDEAQARQDLHRIWQPNSIWQQFIEQATSLTDS